MKPRKNLPAFRVYFSLSVQGKPDYKVGYGDIRICDDNNCF
jgi:hypothetical protein